MQSVLESITEYYYEEFDFSWYPEYQKEYFLERTLYWEINQTNNGNAGSNYVRNIFLSIKIFASL